MVVRCKLHAIKISERKPATIPLLNLVFNEIRERFASYITVLNMQVLTLILEKFASLRPDKRAVVAEALLKKRVHYNNGHTCQGSKGGHYT